MMGIPPDRCGFILEPELAIERGTVPLGPQRWWIEADKEQWWWANQISCCFREIWKDTDRCFWHAEIADKSTEDLASVRVEGLEDLNGAYLSGASFRYYTSFKNCKLKGVDLSGADLMEANLSGATLWSTDLTGAGLQFANLSGATLQYVGLFGADLQFANLSGADLTEANLSGANLLGANLSGATLRYVDFSGANLGDYFSPSSARITDFSGADFFSVNLSGSNLPGVNISKANLNIVNLSGSNLTAANLSGTDFEFADLHEANLMSADLHEANLMSADLRGADLRGADLSGVDFRGADLSGADLREADLSEADFTSIIFADNSPPVLFPVSNIHKTMFDFVDFSNVNFRNHDFSGAKFRQADFSEADLYKTNFEKADLREAIFDEADCRQARFEYADLERASFIECDLRSTNMDDANLYHATLTDCKMNLSTTIADVFTYPPLRAEEQSLQSLHKRAISKLKHVLGDRSTQLPRSDQTDIIHTFQGKPVTGRRPWRERIDLSEWLERRAWSHQTIHRQLIHTGRIGQAIHEKHYLQEEHARLQRARLELRRSWRRLISGGSSERVDPYRSPDEATIRDSSVPFRTLLVLGRRFRTGLADPLRWFVAVINLKAAIRLVRMSESPVYAGRVIFLVATAFTFILYPFAGYFRITTAPIWGGSLLPPAIRTAWQLFVFSLLTFLEGTYLILKGTFGAILPFAAFEPPGGSVTMISGVEPVGFGVWIAWAERFLGALLIVPFALLVIQRLRLYLGSGVSEEGLGGGLLSWLLGK